MTTQERRNQIAWQQFTLNLERRESSRDVHDENDAAFRGQPDDYDETFDIQEPSSRRVHSTGKRIDTLRQNTLKFERTLQIETPTQTIEPAPERLTKAKTRAQRCAIDSGSEETVTTESSCRQKRERRSPYWVARDEKRRAEARAFKTRYQLE
jgi:hypothetical protein